MITSSPSIPDSPEELDRVRSPEISYDCQDVGDFAVAPMKHLSLKWNPATLEWFCTKCGGTSGHISVTDAHAELEQFDCEVPAVEMPEPLVGDESS